MRARDAHMSRFAAARPEALRRSGGRCVKCFAMAAEVHHVNGYEDNRVEMLQPLCYFCHLVAPMGNEYWVWLKSGPSGESTVYDHVMREMRKHYTDEEIDAMARQLLR